jgi:hypothetical protein
MKDWSWNRTHRAAAEKSERLNGKTAGSEEILCARAPVRAANKPSGGGRISPQNKISRRQLGLAQEIEREQKTARLPRFWSRARRPKE